MQSAEARSNGLHDSFAAFRLCVEQVTQMGGLLSCLLENLDIGKSQISFRNLTYCFF